MRGVKRPRQVFESSTWWDERFEQELEDFLTPRGEYGKPTFFRQGYGALRLFRAIPASRTVLHRALQKRDRVRHAQGRLPLCVLMREELDEEYELTRGLLIEFGYLKEGEDAEPICRELRRKWKMPQTEGLEDILL